MNFFKPIDASKIWLHPAVDKERLLLCIGLVNVGSDAEWNWRCTYSKYWDAASREAGMVGASSCGSIRKDSDSFVLIEFDFVWN